MDPMPIVFDISSDEEPTWDEPKGDDYAWLSELLNSGVKEADDSDECVVVGEVNSKQRSKSSKPSAKDDDDCVILDGDPDKPLAVVNDAESENDDLLIVGQKGQVACRDFPHPRHLCAKFPFSSSPHDMHCDLCHCYVCDSLAPCAHWSTGTSGIDHCHATDKEEFWRTQRKSLKLGKDVPLPVAKSANTPQSISVPQRYQAPTCDIIRLAPNSLPQNQFPRQRTIRACYSKRFGIPNIISQSRSQQSGLAPSRRGIQQRAASQQVLGIRNNSIGKERGHGIGNLGSQFVSSNTMSKRLGTAVQLNQSTCATSNNINFDYAAQCAQSPAQLAASNNPTGWQDVRPSANLDSYPPNFSMVLEDELSNQSQVCSQPIPQSNGVQDISQIRVESQNSTSISFSDFDLGWMKNTSQLNQPPPIENLQLHSTGSTNGPLPVKDFHSQFDGSAILPYGDLEYDCWLLGNQSVPVVSEAPVLSPEPATFDAGMHYFDFETFWNSSTYA